MMRGKLLALGLALAGCAQTAPVPLAPSQIKSEAVTPAAWGITKVEVRSFASAGGVATEVSGANCELASPYSTARFVTPAAVSVPDFGSATPVLRITCAQAGQTGAVDVAPALRSTNGLAGWPAIGVSVGTGNNSGVSVGGFWGGGFGTGPQTQQAIYPDARVTMQ